MPDYDDAFFQYVNSGALRSAERVVLLLSNDVAVSSVLDVGCGQGAWLSIWQKLGAEIIGIDGSYVDATQLLIPRDAFVPHDLTQCFNLGRRFDLVQSLEVAEHLPAHVASSFVASLVRHGDLILFSAATKGQGGDHHVNERDYEYWRALFAEHGYVPLDYLRPLLLGDRSVEPWYRYNSLLYASTERVEHLTDAIRCARIPDDQRIRDVSPALYRIRKAFTRLLPVSAMTIIAKLKERTVASVRAKRPIAGIRP